MPLISVPKWPVVDPSPSMGKAIMNFNFRDCGAVVAGGLSGYGFGFYGGTYYRYVHIHIFIC
jgi:hypothetical protein